MNSNFKDRLKVASSFSETGLMIADIDMCHSCIKNSFAKREQETNSPQTFLIREFDLIKTEMVNKTEFDFFLV